MPYKNREEQLKYWRDYSKRTHDPEEAHKYYLKNGAKANAASKKWAVEQCR